MWDKAKVATFISVTVSFFVTLACITTVCHMRNDINELYDEFMVDMKEFNSLTNDAWNNILLMEKETANVNIIPTQKLISTGSTSFKSFFARSSRQATNLPSFCACAAAVNTNCPAGPPGVNGIPGFPGLAGAAGAPGLRGVGGNLLGEVLYSNSCIKCPIGLPGPPGETGKAGLPGQKGEDGTVTQSQQSGLKGPPGPPGDEGEGGPDGLPGPRGEAGTPGIISKPGVRGPKGPSGSSGKSGAPGSKGTPGIVGAPGEPGDRGSVGLQGIPGPRGTPGTSGGVGIPGLDAQYCPCPNRAAILDPSQQAKDYRPSMKIIAAAVQRRFQI